MNKKEQGRINPPLADGAPSMIEKIQIAREKILYIGFLIHFLQDTINYSVMRHTLNFVTKLSS